MYSKCSKIVFLILLKYLNTIKRANLFIARLLRGRYVFVFSMKNFIRTRRVNPYT